MICCKHLVFSLHASLIHVSQISALERALQYLSYPDIEALRNCCLYLHNLTKDMRLSWRLFPLERTLIVTRVVSVRMFSQFTQLMC